MNKKGIIPQKEKAFDLSIFVFFGLSLAGMVTGTAVACLSFSDVDILSFVSEETARSREVLEYFRAALIDELIIKISLIICGLFAFGFLLLPFLNFYFALGMGSSLCSLCMQFEWMGVLYSFCVLFVPFMFCSLSRSVISGISGRVSSGFCRSIAGKYSSSLSRYDLLRLVICLIIDIFSTLLAAWLGSVLHPLIC